MKGGLINIVLISFLLFPWSGCENPIESGNPIESALTGKLSGSWIIKQSSHEYSTISLYGGNEIDKVKEIDSEHLPVGQLIVFTDEILYNDITPIFKIKGISVFEGWSFQKDRLILRGWGTGDNTNITCQFTENDHVAIKVTSISFGFDDGLKCKYEFELERTHNTKIDTSIKKFENKKYWLGEKIPVWGANIQQDKISITIGNKPVNYIYDFYWTGRILTVVPDNLAVGAYEFNIFYSGNMIFSDHIEIVEPERDLGWFPAQVGNKWKSNGWMEYTMAAVATENNIISCWVAANTDFIDGESYLFDPIDETLYNYWMDTLACFKLDSGETFGHLYVAEKTENRMVFINSAPYATDTKLIFEKGLGWRNRKSWGDAEPSQINGRKYFFYY